MSQRRDIPAVALMTLLLAVQMTARADAKQPWSSEATGQKAGYEPVFRDYRKIESMGPAGDGAANHHGHTHHQGHDKNSHPAADESGSGHATNNDASEHQHHH